MVTERPETSLIEVSKRFEVYLSSAKIFALSAYGTCLSELDFRIIHKFYKGTKMSFLNETTFYSVASKTTCLVSRIFLAPNSVSLQKVEHLARLVGSYGNIRLE